MFDFTRVTAVVPPTVLGDAAKNAAYMEEAIKTHGQNASLLLFPALSLTGATLGDLFLQASLAKSVRSALSHLVESTRGIPAAVVVGTPLYCGNAIYNAAVVLLDGRILGAVPKQFLLPSEKRIFSSLSTPTEINGSLIADGADYAVPFGSLLFDAGIRFGIEMCSDVLSPMPPSLSLALGGAELIVNPAATRLAAGGRDTQKDALRALSARLLCGYVSVSAGNDESTTDAVYAGHTFFASAGKLLAENDASIASDYALSMDFDMEKIRAMRLKNMIYRDAASSFVSDIRPVNAAPLPESDGTLLPLRHLPFVPSEKKARQKRALEIFHLQAAGLARRLKTVGVTPVIGVSGGLDSTLALLVSAAAMQRIGRENSEILGITMPAFGTTDRTLKNALALMDAIGITARAIPIKDAVNQHFKDIGHDASVHDATYENAQARERTQVLMDMAGEVGGFVVGTGDLSELALGWCTYNGDHMSMYSVNCGVPKTLLRFIIEGIMEERLFPNATAVLGDILDTPISPELLPPDEAGHIAQRTEDLVGPYALHDFFLYYMVGYGFSPSKIYCLATRAFRDLFTKDEILKWLRTFYRRFFSQQFKRSCMPDGVQVGSIAFSPRGAFSMPSDATAAAWLREIDTLL